MDKKKQHWRNKLSTLKAELLLLEKESKEGLNTVELDQTRVGRLSRMDALQTQAMNNAVAARRKQSLARIKAADNRLDEDEFGFCLKCGDEITEQRLELDPTTLYCTECNNGG